MVLMYFVHVLVTTSLAYIVQPLCDNHDDGETQALILCEKCGNLCGECDRVLHYRRTTKAHQRQVSPRVCVLVHLSHDAQSKRRLGVGILAAQHVPVQFYA